MTARFRLEGPYVFDGTENPRMSGESGPAHTARDLDYCGLVVARTEMEARRAYRTCPERACRRARRCIDPAFSCRATGRHQRLLGFLERGLAIDFAFDELQRMRRVMKKQMRERES
jgi:hypothetical protein